MQAQNTQEDKKPEFFKLLAILLFVGVGVPILVPVAACLLQACLWLYVLSHISGVFFTFGFVETTLFVAALSSFAFLVASVIGFTKFAISRKSFADYLANAKSENEAQVALLKAKGVQFDWNTVTKTTEVYAVYIVANITALVLAAHYFPAKIGFEQPLLILYCALISTALRALYWQVLLLISQYANERLEVVKAKYKLEKPSS